jgi:hypothetical protein
MPTSGAGATSNSASTFGQFHGNIDMLFQQSTNGSPHMNSYFPISSKRSSQQQIHHDMSPHYQAVSTSTPQNDCFEQEVIIIHRLDYCYVFFKESYVYITSFKSNNNNNI